jgi:hypothetical protein
MGAYAKSGVARQTFQFNSRATISEDHDVRAPYHGLRQTRQYHFKMRRLSNALAESGTAGLGGSPLLAESERRFERK